MNKRLIRTNDEAAAGPSFNTVLYTGTFGAESVTGFGFDPDFVWIKNRTNVASNAVFDRVRGDDYSLFTDKTDAELAHTPVGQQFITDGFRIEGNWIVTDANANDYVMWGWKAGGDAVTNTDGDITSEVSANPAAGFSIVSYTGNGVGGSTIGHGLNSDLDMFIVKRRDGPASWAVYHSSVGVNHTLQLDTTSAQISVSGKYSGTNSSVFGVNSASDVNFNNSNYIAYCFAEISGFSKFGSYVGTGGNSVKTISFGFAPAFVMVKRTDTNGNWRMYDSKRDTGTRPFRIDHNLNANLDSAEFDSSAANPYMFFTDDGIEFSLLATNPDLNALNGEYIYMAFANQF